MGLSLVLSGWSGFGQSSPHCTTPPSSASWSGCSVWGLMLQLATQTHAPPHTHTRFQAELSTYRPV